MVDGFIDPGTAAALSALGRDTERARLAESEPTINETGFCLEVPIEGAPLLETLRERIEGLFEVQSDVYDCIRYRNYRPGEGHTAHLDCYEIEGRELIATALLSLRDTPAGGETEFTEVGLAVPPRLGRLLCWYNHSPDGARDPLSRHGGLPVIEGEKEVLLYFIYKQKEYAAHRPFAAGETEVAGG